LNAVRKTNSFQTPKPVVVCLQIDFIGNEEKPIIAKKQGLSNIQIEKPKSFCNIYPKLFEAGT
jgi:hypothetical protein